MDVVLSYAQTAFHAQVPSFVACRTCRSYIGSWTAPSKIGAFRRSNVLHDDFSISFPTGASVSTFSFSTTPPWPFLISFSSRPLCYGFCHGFLFFFFFLLALATFFRRFARPWPNSAPRAKLRRIYLFALEPNPPLCMTFHLSDHWHSGTSSQRMLPTHGSKSRTPTSPWVDKPGRAMCCQPGA